MNNKDFEAWLDEARQKSKDCVPYGVEPPHDIIFNRGAYAAWAKAQDEVENLEQKLAIAVEALQHCSIRSNSNPLDTARQALLKIKGGEGD